MRFIDPDGRFVGDPITVSVAGAAVVIGTGILVTAAIIDAAKNNHGKIPSQWEVGASLLKTGLQAYNDIKNWFTEEQKTSGAGSEGESSQVDWNNPVRPEQLGDTWKETTSNENKSGNHKEYSNTETGEKVRFDKGVSGAKGYEGKDHYHRYNPKSTGKKDKYLDKNGNPCKQGSKASHIVL